MAIVKAFSAIKYQETHPIALYLMMEASFAPACLVECTRYASEESLSFSNARVCVLNLKFTVSWGGKRSEEEAKVIAGQQIDSRF